MSQTHPPDSRLKVLLELSIPLIAGVVTALVWANADQSSYQAMTHWNPFADSAHAPHYNLHFFFNDIFMVLFFGVAAGEITEAIMPGGRLSPPSRAVNPLLGTLGGVVGPIGAYFFYAWATGDMARLSNGWGIPTATDMALAWLVARIVFGRSHPAVSFLLLLAVADDAIGLGIIAVAYPNPDHPAQPVYLLLVVGGMLIAYALRRAHVRNFSWYLVGPGVLSWCGLYFAQLHPALALVAIVPFMPCMAHDEGLFGEGQHVSHPDTLNRFQHAFRAPVDVGLFGFGLTNAGVAVGAVGNPTWAVLFALVVGKTLGIFLFSRGAHRMGFPLPKGMHFRSLFVAGVIAALGLTVALFVADQAFPKGELQDAAKMGALLSAGVAPLAIFVGRALRVRDK